MGLAAACAFTACGPDAAQDEAAVRAVIDREVAAFNGEDLKALSEIWAQNEEITLVDVPPPGLFDGWSRIAGAFRDFFDRVSEIHLTVDDVRIRVSGDIAYATYGWAMTGKVGERPLVDRGRATAVYRRVDGGWRMVHAHYSPVPPALALETETEPPAAAPGGEGQPRGGS